MPQNTQNRPLSPHLSIYRWQISSVLSILHRLTGIALYAGTFLLVAWLWSAAYSAPCYKAIRAFMATPPGQLMLIGWTFAFFYHLAAGIRHLWWDTGRGFAIPEVHRTGWTIVVFAFVMTFTTWWLAMQPSPQPLVENEENLPLAE